MDVGPVEEPGTFNTGRDCFLVVLFMTAGPITKLGGWGGSRIVEDTCYRIQRASACVD